MEMKEEGMYVSQGSGKGSLKGGIGAVAALANRLPLEHLLDAELLVAGLASVRTDLTIQLQTRILRGKNIK